MAKTLRVPCIIIEDIEEAEVILKGLYSMHQSALQDIPEKRERIKNLIEEVKKIIIIMGKRLD